VTERGTAGNAAPGHGTAAVNPLLEWVDEETLRCCGVLLRTVYDERNLSMESTPGEFVLAKSRPMIEWYRGIASDFRDGNVLEIGIFLGGSVVLFLGLLQPRKLVAFDLSERPIAALEQFLSDNGSSQRVLPRYGVDQADIAVVQDLIRREFAGEQLDLVVDDGCHLLAESRASFDAVFPFVRPGGLYIIEDWAWAHWPGMWQEDGGPWRDKPSTTLMILELAMLAASRPDLIASLEVTRDLVAVRKASSAQVDAGLGLSKSYLTAGRVFSEEGFSASGTQVVGDRSTLLQRIEDLETQVRADAAALDDVHEVLRAAAAQRAELAEVLNSVERSLSWRLTAPLRRLGRHRRGA
jgi:predicted O-methyltransferase YrrM